MNTQEKWEIRGAKTPREKEANRAPQELQEKRGKQGALESGEWERARENSDLKGEIWECENTKGRETLVRGNTKGKEENRAREHTDLKTEIRAHENTKGKGNSGAREQERRNSGTTFLLSLRIIPPGCCATN